tara:strand:- start:221 stop:910 length:690 start_codon:yes stop_codon:yes gene_type:complete
MPRDNSRDIQKLINTKQDNLVSSSIASISNLQEGQISISNDSSNRFGLFLKRAGKIYKTYLSPDGSVNVDDTLTTNNLKYKHTFTDYRTYIHNFAKDLDTTKTYLPWTGPKEGTTLLQDSNGFLTPYKMTCQKILFRAPAIDTAATDIVFSIEKVDSGDASTDSICTFDATSNWVDNTNFTISLSDWSATPTVDAGDVVAIGIQADNTNIVTSSKHFFVTSIWKVDVSV